MVKLFFIGIGIFLLVVVGAFAAVFTPLLGGVNRNLGGSPRMPFHSPVPQPAVDVVHGWIAQATPSVWLAVVLGLLALLFVYMVGAFVAHLARRWTERRKRYAEARNRAHMLAAREQTAAPGDSRTAYEYLSTGSK